LLSNFFYFYFFTHVTLKETPYHDEDKTNSHAGRRVYRGLSTSMRCTVTAVPTGFRWSTPGANRVPAKVAERHGIPHWTTSTWNEAVNHPGHRYGGGGPAQPPAPGGGPAGRRSREGGILVTKPLGSAMLREAKEMLDLVEKHGRVPRLPGGPLLHAQDAEGGGIG
jgi:hypothetical protein